jgi:6-phospho-beta-glucosidase
VTPVRVEELEPLYAGLVAHVTAYEQLALDAALRGGYDRVFKALLAHPLVGQDDQATGLAERLIAENRHYLAWA